MIFSQRAVSTECFCCPIRDKMLVATVIPKQYRAVGTACGIKCIGRFPRRTPTGCYGSS
jgi:hypothetical protein